MNNPGTRARLFVAIPISESHAELIERNIEALRRRATGIRWTPPDSYHITLAFLGEWPAAQIPDIVAAIAEAVQATPAFDIAIHGLGFFPDDQAPRVLWAGVASEAEVLPTMWSRVTRNLEQLGYADDPREYTPHLTLGRIATDSNVTEVLGSADDSVVRMPVDEVWLYSSSWGRTNQRQPVYEQVAAIQLAPPA